MREERLAMERRTPYSLDLSIHVSLDTDAFLSLIDIPVGSRVTEKTTDFLLYLLI